MVISDDSATSSLVNIFRIQRDPPKHPLSKRMLSLGARHANNTTIYAISVNSAMAGKLSSSSTIKPNQHYPTIATLPFQSKQSSPSTAIAILTAPSVGKAPSLEDHTTISHTVQPLLPRHSAFLVLAIVQSAFLLRDALLLITSSTSPLLSSLTEALKYLIVAFQYSSFACSYFSWM